MGIEPGSSCHVLTQWRARCYARERKTCFGISASSRTLHSEDERRSPQAFVQSLGDKFRWHFNFGPACERGFVWGLQRKYWHSLWFFSFKKFRASGPSCKERSCTVGRSMQPRSKKQTLSFEERLS